MGIKIESNDNGYNVNVGEITDHEARIKSVENYIDNNEVFGIGTFRYNIEMGYRSFHREIWYIVHVNILIEVARFKTPLRYIYILENEAVDYYPLLENSLNSVGVYIGDL